MYKDKAWLHIDTVGERELPINKLIFSGLLGNQNLHAHVLLKCEIGKNEFEVVNNHLYCFILIQLLNQQQRHDPLCSCIFKHVAKIEHQSWQKLFQLSLLTENLTFQHFGFVTARSSNDERPMISNSSLKTERRYWRDCSARGWRHYLTNIDITLDVYGACCMYVSHCLVCYVNFCALNTTTGSRLVHTKNWLVDLRTFYRQMLSSVLSLLPREISAPGSQD